MLCVCQPASSLDSVDSRVEVQNYHTNDERGAEGGGGEGGARRLPAPNSRYVPSFEQPSSDNTLEVDRREAPAMAGVKHTGDAVGRAGGARCRARRGQLSAPSRTRLAARCRAPVDRRVGDRDHYVWLLRAAPAVRHEGRAPRHQERTNRRAPRAHAYGIRRPRAPTTRHGGQRCEWRRGVGKVVSQRATSAGAQSIRAPVKHGGAALHRLVGAHAGPSRRSPRRMQFFAAPSARRRRWRRGCSQILAVQTSSDCRGSPARRLSRALLLLPQLRASEITDGNVNDGVLRRVGRRQEGLHQAGAGLPQVAAADGARGGADGARGAVLQGGGGRPRRRGGRALPALRLLLRPVGVGALLRDGVLGRPRAPLQPALRARRRRARGGGRASASTWRSCTRAALEGGGGATTPRAAAAFWNPSLRAIQLEASSRSASASAPRAARSPPTPR